MSDNVLIEVARVPALMAEHGVDVTIGTTFGAYVLLEGLLSVVGTKAG